MPMVREISSRRTCCGPLMLASALADVGAAAAVQQNLPGFCNRGLVHYLKVEETGGLVTGTIPWKSMVRTASIPCFTRRKG